MFCLSPCSITQNLLIAMQTSRTCVILLYIVNLRILPSPVNDKFCYFLNDLDVFLKRSGWIKYCYGPKCIS